MYTAVQSTKPPIRSSKNRQAIADLLTQTAGFMTAQEVYEMLHEQGHKLGLATVYRGLQTLVDIGVADMIRRPDGDMAYRKCSKTHHHHLVCVNCSMAIEIQADALEQWANKIASEHHFIQVAHDVELTGLCEDCAAKLDELDDDPLETN